MTGKPLYNWEAFTRAKRLWREARHMVITPFDVTNAIWEKKYGKKYDVYRDKVEYGSDVMLDAWLGDTRVLLWADAIALLPEWETSRGSRIEVQTAILFGKRIFEAFTFKELKLSAVVQFVQEAT